MAKQTPEELEQRQAAEEAAERKLHRSMMDETELEIGRSAFDQEEEPIDDGDRSLEEPEEDIAGGDPEEEEQEEEPQESEDEEQDGEPQDEGEGETPAEQPQRDEQSGRFVPSYRLREQTERAERAERELAEMRMRGMPPPQPQQPPQPPPPKPDMFVDPEAHERWMFQQWSAQQQHAHAERSLQEAAEEHGDDFRYAYDTLVQGVRRGDPQAQQIVSALYASPNPGRALMRWAQPLLEQRQDQQEQAHREWLRERYGIDAEQLEQREARSNGRSASRQTIAPRRNVPSLNSAGGSGPPVRARADARGMDGSEEAIFDYAFTPIRR